MFNFLKYQKMEGFFFIILLYFNLKESLKIYVRILAQISMNTWFKKTIEIEFQIKFS